MFQTTPVISIGCRNGCRQTNWAPSLISSTGWRGGAAGRSGSCSRHSRATAASESTAARTKAEGAPAQATSAPASAGPPAKAALRASSRRPLARPSSSRGTSAGTSAGAATLKPTVPTAPMNPSTASHVIDRPPARTMASSPSSESARNTSAATIRRRRETRSASSPSGIDSSRNGSVCTAASVPISPGPAPSASTATSGTAARLSCSADWAARLEPASAVKERGNEVLGI